MTIYSSILSVHITGGFVALCCAFFACLIKQFNLNHKWHIYIGRAFMIGYAVIFTTALAMVFLKTNRFLSLIAFFSFYLALSGFRYAKNKKGEPQIWDWLLHCFFLLVAIGMVVFGIYSLLHHQNTEGIVSLVFGSGSILFTTRQLKNYKNKIVFKGNHRIAKHFTFMLAGSIGTVTAFVVTNFDLQPAFILWLAPTAVITPYITYWNRKILKNDISLAKGLKVF